MTLLGPLAALASSVTWAYASTRYAQASRDVGSSRVNLARALCVVPIYFVVTLLQRGGGIFDGVTPPKVAWLFASVLCSYAIADNLFFTAARRLGISTALSIASTYPLWAAVVGAIFGGEPFGPLRAGGTLLCVGGVIALVRLGPMAKASAEPHRTDVLGVVLAFIASILWAGNSISVKHGAVDLSAWQANAIRYAIALVLLCAQVGFARTPPARKAPMAGWLWLVPAILTDALCGSMFYVYGLSHTDLAVGSTLSSLAPLISVPVAIAVGEERWSAPRFLAVTTTTIGVVVLILSGA